MLTMIDHPPHFKEGTRTLLLRGRPKDGLTKNRAVPRVSHSADQFDKVLSDLAAIAVAGERIYASAGPRNLKRAIRTFKERQLAADYDDEPEAFYRGLESRWASAVMDPTSQAQKFWLFDCDSEEDAELARVEIAASYDRPFLPYWYKTKSGQHAVVQAFDKSRLSDRARAMLHDNALMLYAF